LICCFETVRSAQKSFSERGCRRVSKTEVLEKPQVINTDRNPAYGEAIVELKKEGLLTGEQLVTLHRRNPGENSGPDSDRVAPPESLRSRPQLENSIHPRQRMAEAARLVHDLLWKFYRSKPTSILGQFDTLFSSGLNGRSYEISPMLKLPWLLDH
jgi:hypothetical protein